MTESRVKILLVTLLIIIVVSLATVWLGGSKFTSKEAKASSSPQASSPSHAEIIIQKAHSLYIEKKQLGVDFSKGPCLTEQLEPDWVLDMVHNPRQLVDDQPVNQCQTYLQGKTHHFVEMDPEGNVIRLQ